MGNWIISPSAGVSNPNNGTFGLPASNVDVTYSITYVDGTCSSNTITYLYVANPCTCSDYTASTTSASFDATGNTVTVGSIGADCTVNGSGASWISVAKNGTSVELTADPNDGDADRSGNYSILVGGVCSTISVSQPKQETVCPTSGCVQTTSSVGYGGADCVAVVAYRTDEFTANTFSLSGTGWSFCSSGDSWGGHAGYALLKMNISPNSSENEREFKVSHTGTTNDGTQCTTAYTITQSGSCLCSDFNVNGTEVQANCPSNSGEVITSYLKQIPSDGGSVGEIVWFKKDYSAFTDVDSITYDGVMITGATWGRINTGSTGFPGTNLVLECTPNTGTNTRTGGTVSVTMKKSGGGTCGPYTITGFTQQNASAARKAKVVVHLTGTMTVGPAFNFVDSSGKVVLSVSSTNNPLVTIEPTWSETTLPIVKLVILGGGSSGSTWPNVSVGNGWDEPTQSVTNQGQLLGVYHSPYNPNGYSFCDNGCDGLTTNSFNSADYYYSSTAKEIHVEFKWSS